MARDLNDLRRVHQLLVSSLTKLHTKTNSTQLYNESMATLEKLSILKAWAEVYIMAMIGNGSAPASLIMKKLSTPTTTVLMNLGGDEGTEFGEFESRGESLLSLVQPELVNLSQHWLAALKDHALLLLPSEYASQLPHEGGAFYTTDTMNSSKYHYLASWPPILHAASLWLNSGGFDEPKLDNDQSDNNNGNPTIGHGSLSADRFHLIFGICMEALCNPRRTDKVECVITCLQALYTIFDSKWSRDLLKKSSSLNIELCNVLHRLILTRDSLDVQLLCLEVLKQTILTAKELIDENMLNDDEKTDRRMIDDGEIVPGKSHVYAVLEVCLCLFVRQIPAMNPSQNSRLVTEQLQLQLRLSNSNGIFKLNEDNGMLISSALQCIEGLTKLCSAQVAVSILPTILYLTTAVIKEIAKKSVTDQTILANSGTIQSALHCLKSLAKDKYATDSDEEIQEEWKKLLQSSLGKIIDLTKTGCEETKMDEVTMMLAIAVFLLHTPASLVSIPSLQYPCINHFRQCLQSDNIVVKIKCIQTMRSVFINADLRVSTPYIHALAPRVIEGLYSDVSRTPKNDGELAMVLESITTVEALIALAEPQNRKFFLLFLSNITYYNCLEFLTNGMTLLFNFNPVPRSALFYHLNSPILELIEVYCV